MLINADDILYQIQNFRICHIGGRYGGAKTALATKIAVKLVEQKYANKIIANFPIVFADPVSELRINEKKHVDAVIVLDEGGTFLKTNSDADIFTHALRKINSYLLIPSRAEPSAKMRSLTIQRLYTLKTVGIPIWIYKWTLKDGSQKDKGFFGWYKPQEIFGVYSTQEYSITDKKISDQLAEVIRQITGEEGEEYISRYYNRDKAQTNREYIAELENVGWELQNTIQEAKEAIGSIPIHKRRGKA